jgi:hypothetical protein
MLRIIITSLLMVNAIFWGIYPPNEDSPHSLIIKYLGIDYKPTKITHLIIGVIFYIIGVLISQQKSIQNFWF